jgi:hypothetical protein
MARRVALEHHYAAGIRTKIDDGYWIAGIRAGSLGHARHYIKGSSPLGPTALTEASTTCQLARKGYQRVNGRQAFRSVYAACSEGFSAVRF